MFKKKKKKVKRPKEDGSKPTRISGYDYRKWDKFNVVWLTCYKIALTIGTKGSSMFHIGRAEE